MATNFANSNGKRRNRRRVSPGSAALIDPHALMRIKDLQMRAKVVVEGFFSGLHRSPYHGFSVEFSEYRQYTPGDDPRYLDWKLYARSDRYYVKRFEDETNLRCYLLVDQSRSMGFSSGSFSKAEYARTLAATLAYFLATQRDAVGLLTFDAEIAEYLPPRYRPGHLHRLMLCLEQELAGTSTDLAAPFEQIARTVSKRGVVVLISDLLAPVDTLGTHLGYLRMRGHEVIVMRILDPAERELQFDAPAMFHDLESGRDLYVDPATARETYRQRFAEHESVVSKMCANLGIEYVSLSTQRPLELALFDFLQTRLRRGKTVARKGAMRAAGGSTA
jgi:uncharacterized protein (DUF58 family)